MNIQPLFSDAEYKRRHRDLLSSLQDIDLSFIFSRADTFYYSGTGFDGMIEVSTDLKRYTRRNISLCMKESVLPVEEMKSFSVFKEIKKEYSNIKSIGLELDILPQRTVEYILKVFPSIELHDISFNLRQIRASKSQEELEYLQAAANQTDASFEYIAEKIKPGVSEIELSTQIDTFLRKEGHPGYVQIRMFHHNYTTSGYVMSGESTATLNSYFGPVSGAGSCRMHKNGPSKRKIQTNDTVLIDTTGVVEGYTADETRTFFVGKADPVLVAAMDCGREVQLKCKQLLKAGKLTNEIYHQIWQLAKESEMQDNFMGIGNDRVPFVGHGTGLELDELPIISNKFKDQLNNGNVIAIEPKFVFERPITGVGIEDTWVVVDQNPRKLTNFPWDN